MLTGSGQLFFFVLYLLRHCSILCFMKYAVTNAVEECPTVLQISCKVPYCPSESVYILRADKQNAESRLQSRRSQVARVYIHVSFLLQNQKKYLKILFNV